MTYQKNTNDSPPKKTEVERPIEISETVVPGLSAAEYDAIRNNALERAKTTKHGWRMKGGWLRCTTCEYPHGQFVGVNKVLVGIDSEGKPILEQKKFTSFA